MRRLRAYGPMRRRSAKTDAGREAFAAVYAEVDARSDGQCEVWTADKPAALTRCPRRALEHHHLYKPRRSHHTATEVVHVCRPCHDRMEWPYSRGRLCLMGLVALARHEGGGVAFVFALRYAPSKFVARGTEA